MLNTDTTKRRIKHTSFGKSMVNNALDYCATGAKIPKIHLMNNGMM